jgi:hypothetical protein
MTIPYINGYKSEEQLARQNQSTNLADLQNEMHLYNKE